MSEKQHDPTTSDDDSSNQGLVDPDYPDSHPLAVEDPNILADGLVAEDSFEERSARIDRTADGEDAQRDRPPALIDSDSDGDDGYSLDTNDELLADLGDVDDSPEADAVHIVEE